MASPTAPPRPSSTFPTLVAVGVLVVAAGLLLPRVLSLSPTPAVAVGGSPFTSDRSPPPSAERPALPTPAVAPTSVPRPDTTPAAGESASLTWVLAKLMFGLAIVAGVCIGVARWSNRVRPDAQAGILTPLAKLAVDPRCVVHLVAAGGRRLLIGVDAAGVKAVLELPPK